MMATIETIVRRVPLGPVIGAMFGAAAVALVAATPPDLFAAAVHQTGLSPVFGAPPFGLASRLAAFAIAFLTVAVVVGGIVWAADLLRNRFAAPAADLVEADTRAEIRASGRRRPISADRELGAPLMSDEALTAVAPPVDGAADGVSLDDALGSSSEVPPLSAGQELWLDTPADEIALEVETPEPEPPEPEVSAVVPPFVAPEPTPEPAGDPFLQIARPSTIDAMIERLEAGLAHRAPDTDPDAPPAMVETPAPPRPHHWMVADSEKTQAREADDAANVPTVRASAAR